MKLKNVFSLVSLPLVLSACASTVEDKIESKVKQPEKPNILFVMVDDLGWGDVGYNGSQWVETPNIDQLAENGKVFNNAYMYPTCSPSRAALATGKQSYKTQVYTVPVLEKGSAETDIFSRWTVGSEHKFYSEFLNEAGYKLAHFGKWHLVGPNLDDEKTYPFSDNLTQPESGETEWIAEHKSDKYKPFYPAGRGYHQNVGGTWWGDPARGYSLGYKSESGGYHAPFKNPYVDEKPSDEWLTDRLTDDAIAFMEANKDEPFFINLHYYTVHRPSISRSDELLEKYRNKPTELLTGKGAKSKKQTAAFGTLLENMDQNFGRLVNYLDESGLRKNTVIVFTSDNGFHGGQSTDKRFRGAKGDIYEGGVKVPAVISWPDHIKPGAVDTPITVLDYFPTFLDIANVKTDYLKEIDGRSILPLAFDIELDEKPVIWHIASTYRQPPLTAMRKGDWKLIQFLNSGAVELYHLKRDPTEQHNLANLEPELTGKLVAELAQWRRINNVPLPPKSTLDF